MKKSELSIILIFFFFNTVLFSQDDYQMKPGETIIVDNDGRILNSNKNPRSLSKYNPGINASSSNGLKVSNYNEDGTLKLPGYHPTGNSVVDAENYKKAKFLFYQKNPEEFKKWQQKHSAPPHEGHFKEIKKEEFDKLPANKKQLILSNPGKYKIVK